MFMVDGDECVWHVLSECFEGEGYTVIAVGNDDEGGPQEHVRLILALPPQETL
jgi:hypothetical protein